ncbi:MAG: Gfo/Idh/MocA family oxidoreductase [Desulfobulbaceae bacterium]|uniref:Gfo/Idh/MocA family oxidoreductase n=1 Tax=Candidatus Desulfobia pelagia TaxID=2841692 RepID=A0A8J6TER1_9BACT|nr:Gfo/Idh/MocA family oxidoreductase [Candidatus Desulfobia pelagia]
MNNKKIKIGVIGVGYLGKFHAQKYAAMDDVELVGVADVSKTLTRQVAASCNTTPFDDYMELLDLVDGVSIVVPTPYHHKVASTCLNRGVDVMLEKPMTVTLEEADDLIAIADAKNLILQVGHLERFNPAIVAMEEYLTSPLIIESQRVHKFNPRGADVDVVLDLMIHDIDIILNVVPSPLKTIQTIGAPIVTRETDVANAQLTFENGCTANVTVSRVAHDNVRSLRIFQPGSSITVNYATKEITVIERGEGLTEQGFPQETMKSFCFTDKDALQDELIDFVQNVRTRQTPLVSGRDGRQALAVALQIISQIKQHISSHQDLLGNRSV